MSDYISRQAAIDAVNGMPDCPNGYSDTYDKRHIIAVLEDVPSVQPERKKGRWIDVDDHVMCSCCGAAHYGADKNYCPNCGSYNGGGQDET